MKATTETTAAQPGSVQRMVRRPLQNQLHEFVDGILNYAQDPSCWPLTREEQVAFVRTIIYQARKIAKSEEYLAESVSMAADRIGKGVMTPNDRTEPQPEKL